MRDWLLNLLLALVAVFAPAKAMILSSMVLVLADFVTGVLAAHKQRIPITSAGMQRTIVKLFIYELAIVLGFITEVYLLGDAIPASKIIAGFVGITELKSCLENLNTISGQDLLKQAIKKLGSKNQ